MHKFVVLFAEWDDILVGKCAGEWLDVVKVAMRLVAARITAAVVVRLERLTFFLGGNVASGDFWCGVNGIFAAFRSFARTGFLGGGCFFGRGGNSRRFFANRRDFS